jgi:hypothetical protein
MLFDLSVPATSYDHVACLLGDGIAGRVVDPFRRAARRRETVLRGLPLLRAVSRLQGHVVLEFAGLDISLQRFLQPLVY